MTTRADIPQHNSGVEPELVNGERAADIVGCRNEDHFRREVKSGVWPSPLTIKDTAGRIKIPDRWRVCELRRKVAYHAGALQDSADIMERINDTL